MNKCPDCGGELENGVMLDTTYGATLVQRYAKSDNIPTEAKNYIVGNNEANFTDLRRVVAHRCLRCNRIFQYAQDTVVLKDLNKRVRHMYIFVVVGLVIVFTVIIILGFSIFEIL